MPNFKVSKNTVAKELKLAIGDILIDERKALLAATSYLKAESQQLTPVEFGVLRNSAFSVVFRRGNKMVGRVGYTAKYAPYVHEAPMKLKGKARGGKRKGSYWSTGENKFLEKAYNRNIGTITRILTKRLKR